MKRVQVALPMLPGGLDPGVGDVAHVLQTRCLHLPLLEEEHGGDLGGGAGGIGQEVVDDGE